VVFAFFSGLLDALMTIVHKGLKLLPIAVWAFVTILMRQVLSEESQSLNAVGGFMLTVVSANLIQGLIVLPLLLLIKGVRPWELFFNMKEALVMAFFTRSSSATLPVTLDHAVKNAGISEDIARITLPLCTTINMNGCAQFILLSFYFVCGFSGYDLDFFDHIVMILIAVIAAIGNAGVPMGCFFLASSILASKNIPIHIMGSILPLYAFMDMVETALNVWSDVSVAKIVDQEKRARLIQS
jgi:Na+/H+-dicarboxylate symporter